VVTDPVPRAAERRRQYAASDERKELALPGPEPLRSQTNDLLAAVAAGEAEEVRRAGLVLMSSLCAGYEIATPKLQVLGIRPHEVTEGVCTYQLYGDYTPASQRIRVWLRTAMRGKVTTGKGFLSTLLHELCHHLDVKAFAWPESPHTRGFFGRVDVLYHHALATPAAQRRPLVWRKARGVWVIDWARSRTR
jgi:hypothetical protein